MIFFFKFLFLLILLYNTVLVLPYIDMNPPQVYMSSQHEPPSHLPPHIISLDHPHAPAPSILYPALNVDRLFISYMILYFIYVYYFLLFLNFYFYFILLYNTVLVLPYIDMNLPWVYMSSQS